MSIAYLNGRFLPLEEAQISVLDRGFLFADGIYEVIPVYHHKPFGMQEHLQRMEQSLAAIELATHLDLEDWAGIIHEIIERNNTPEQQLYIQVTRGCAPVRSHPFPANVEPTILVCSFPLVQRTEAQLPLKAICVPDTRWKRCNIKAIALLPNILAIQEAVKAGADEPILINDGYAIESARSNLFVIKNGVINTTPAGSQILGGITRQFILALAKEHGIEVQERMIPEAELQQADEIWITGSASELRPVIELDKQPVGDGLPGPVWQLMHKHYQAYKQQVTQGG